MITDDTKTSLTSLFLSQSYSDAWEDYQRSLVREDFPIWDYIILTAADERQAAGFSAQIALRRERGDLPPRTHFAVIPDPNGERVGSGGATLSAIKYIARAHGTENFENLRILVIHSGGDSKRVPQYSALGKLFSPVPHELPNGNSSTLFDEFMISVSAVPGRLKSGMLLLSGDVLLLFNPLLIDFSGKGAAAISFKENVETGKNHGVFLRGEDGYVKKCLQKQSEKTLRAEGAVNDRDCVDIDTGAIIFSTDILTSLYSLFLKDGKYCEEYFNAYVNSKVRLSLYTDFLHPLAADTVKEDFLNETPEGEICPELIAARNTVWEKLRPYRIKLLRLAPSKFIHFGTSREILQLMSSGVTEYSQLGWSRRVNSSFSQNAAGYNSIIAENCTVGNNVYLENSRLNADCTVGDNVILSYIDLPERTYIPNNVVLHGLKLNTGKFCARIFGISDNIKGSITDTFLGGSLDGFISANALSKNDIWDLSEPNNIWNAKIFPICDDMPSAVAAALNLYDLFHGCGDIGEWKKLTRCSLSSGFSKADAGAIIAWETRMGDLVRMERILSLIRTRRPATEAIPLLNTDRLTPIQEKWLNSHTSSCDFFEKMRLYYYIGTALGNSRGEQLISQSFSAISRELRENTHNTLKIPSRLIPVDDTVTVTLPLRVNFGGGWSDTPPYCNEMGGTVLNAAIKLDGDYPVKVTVKKTPKRAIIFDSRDMDVHGEFDEISLLQATGDPFDPFALQKAALCACKIIPKSGGNLDTLFNTLGGGFIINSEVTGVPKGSGLGTSSVLAAACVKALFLFFGIDFTESSLYSTVLVMEQIMSTGGGWQDQVGGLSNGFKLITSAAGINQQLNVEHFTLDDATAAKLGERFVLIYTGQRRLARNLLRDVVGKYIGNCPNAINCLNEIQKLAVLMTFELKRGNIDAFACLLNRHWELSKELDAGSSNILIEQIFESIAEFTAGKMICGAGGGGFLQVVLKENVLKSDVHKRLKDVFMDSDIDIWNCDFV